MSRHNPEVAHLRMLALEAAGKQKALVIGLRRGIGVVLMQGQEGSADTLIVLLLEAAIHTFDVGIAKDSRNETAQQIHNVIKERLGERGFPRRARG